MILFGCHIALVLVNDHDRICKCTDDNAKDKEEILDVFDRLSYQEHIDGRLREDTQCEEDPLEVEQGHEGCHLNDGQILDLALGVGVLDEDPLLHD